MRCASTFEFSNGVVVKNRFVKAATTEHLADPRTNLPNDELCLLYERWAHGGCGMVFTGNVQVDRRFMEAPRNVALEAKDEADLSLYKKWAERGKANGTKLIMQISHSGKQMPVSVGREALCPSEVYLEMAGVITSGPLKMMAKPRAMTHEEVLEAIDRFATTARLAEKSGFDGVEIHAAHGYLLSEFLSGRANLRTDEWGGSAEKRRRVVLEVVRRVRAAVSPSFIVGLKVNSADMQKGGFTEQESVDLLRSLEAAGVHFIEVSGGSYEYFAPLDNTAVKKSTADREAFFIDYCKQARSAVKTPLVLTGGFTTIEGIEKALVSNVDFVGVARPTCTDPYAVNKMLSGEITAFVREYPNLGSLAMTRVALSSMYHTACLGNWALPKVNPSYRPSVAYLLLYKFNVVYLCDPKKNPCSAALMMLSLSGTMAGLAWLSKVALTSLGNSLA